MKIKTLIPVTYNSGIKTQLESKIEGIITLLIQDENGYIFNYKYTTEEGFELKSGSIRFSKDEINELYLMVVGNILPDLNYSDTTMYVFLLGMKIKMAETFGISPNDIEIVD